MRNEDKYHIAGCQKAPSIQVIKEKNESIQDYFEVINVQKQSKYIIENELNFTIVRKRSSR